MNIVDEFGLEEDRFIWQDLAMCHNLPLGVFYEDADTVPGVEGAAKEICAYCPVRQMCLDAAIENKDQGIHGGENITPGGKIR